MSKDMKLIVRCSEADIIRWKAQAEREGDRWSDWVRQSLDKAAGTNRGVKRAAPPPARVEPAPVEEPVRQRDVSLPPVAVGREPAPSQLRVPALDSGPAGFARLREQARDLATTNGKCTADVARGTRCKLCGKIH